MALGFNDQDGYWVRKRCYSMRRNGVPRDPGDVYLGTGE